LPIDWEGDDKEVYDWAVKAIAQELILQDKENFAQRFPPDELKQTYAVIDSEILPILMVKGIPISREELREMFLSWFVRKDLPPERRDPFRTPRDAGQSGKTRGYGTESSRSLETLFVTDDRNVFVNDQGKAALKEKLKSQLTPEQYDVCFLGGTERAFTGKYWNSHDRGTYHCVVCGAELFDSSAKFDSRTGWPSFYQPISKDKLKEESDYGFGMKRTEVTCSNCGAHLGHVFDDGPNPTGMRYCINSTALQHEKDMPKSH
jgi:peptide-methionine (R)-S-oxide reductase